MTQVEAFMKENNVKLPKDMLEIAKQSGLRLGAINAYIATQVRRAYTVLGRRKKYVNI